MPDKPHILFIPRWYPHGDDPMIGLFVKNLANCLAGHFRISVLHIRGDSSASKALAVNGRIQDGIFVAEAVVGASSGYYWRRIVILIRYVRAFLNTWSSIRRYNGRPALVHVHVLTRCGVMAAWLKMTYGIPYVVSEHWSRYYPENNQYKGFFRKLITRLVLRQASVLIVVSNALRKAMEMHGLHHARTFIIANTVDTDVFTPATGTKSHTSTVFIHISCFDEKAKNIRALVDAFAQVVTEGYHVELWLVGDGPDRRMIEQHAGTLSVCKGSIKFYPVLTPHQLVELIRQANFTIQTSRYETFGTVVMESFACGVPVVSTATGIFPEVVSPLTGVLISGFEPDDIVVAIKEAISRNGLFDRKLMRDIAIERCNPERVAAQLMAVYNPLLQKT